MRYHAEYKDDRDVDESAIAECLTADDAIAAIKRYFKLNILTLDHMEYWQVIEHPTGDFVAGGTKI